jgi:ABC-type amino acid transport substrate-binding protein
MFKRNFARILAVMLVVFVAFTFVGCGKTKTLKKVEKEGKIVLGTSADYPPYEFHAEIDGKDTIVGFDIEIAKEIAKDLGVELEIKDMDFDGLLPALAAGKIDFVIAGMTPEPERMENADFSKIYYEAVHGIVVRKEDAESIKSLDDLTGKRVGVQKATIQADIAKEQIDSPSEIRELPRTPDLIMMLQNNKVDAVIMEQPVAKQYVKANDDIVLAPQEIHDEEGGSAIAVAKDNPEMIEKINASLDRLISEGKIDQFVAEAGLLAEQNIQE